MCAINLIKHYGAIWFWPLFSAVAPLAHCPCSSHVRQPLTVRLAGGPRVKRGGWFWRVWWFHPAGRAVCALAVSITLHASGWLAVNVAGGSGWCPSPGAVAACQRAAWRHGDGQTEACNRGGWTELGNLPCRRSLAGDWRAGSAVNVQSIQPADWRGLRQAARSCPATSMFTACHSANVQPLPGSRKVKVASSA